MPTICEALGISTTLLQQLERGEKNWSVARLVQIASVFGLPAPAFFDEHFDVDGVAMKLTAGEARVVNRLREGDPIGVLGAVHAALVVNEQQR